VISAKIGLLTSINITLLLLLHHSLVFLHQLPLVVVLVHLALADGLGFGYVVAPFLVFYDLFQYFVALLFEEEVFALDGRGQGLLELVQLFLEVLEYRHFLLQLSQFEL